MRRAVWAVLYPAMLLAQPPVAPTDERVGRARGEDYANYNLVQSWELGVRFRDVNGDLGKYRSDVNFANGLRLLSGRLSLNSKDGRGGLLDELTLSTQGLGNDPYQSALLRVQKNGLYRYDMLWRSNAYFNPAAQIAQGQHLMDTERRMQDHDFVLLPQSSFRILAGFTRVSQTGTGLSTAMLFDERGDIYPVFGRINRGQKEYRLGNDVKLAGFRVNWMWTREQYEEMSPLVTDTVSQGNNASDRTELRQFARSEPYNGTVNGWRVNVMREKAERWAVMGGFTRSEGERAFALDETAVATDRFGAARNRQILVSGTGRRPVTTANLTLSLFPAQAVTVTNHTSYHDAQMQGTASLAELQNSTGVFSFTQFHELKIRNVTNESGVQVRPRRWLLVRGGFQYSAREIVSLEGEAFEGGADRVEARQENRLKAVTAGFRVQPGRGFSITMDGELGRQGRPVYPISEKDYHAYRARADYRAKNVTLSVRASDQANFNSVSFSTHSARARQVGADAYVQARPWLMFEAGYARLNSNTATSIAYFVNFNRVDGDRALWVSNLHTAHAGFHVTLKDRVDIYGGYSRTEDTGDGRGVLSVPAAGRQQGSVLPELRAAQVFPMLFDSPLARVSVRIHPKMRINVGYQHYRYSESVLPLQNYRAHTGFSSVLWTF